MTGIKGISRINKILLISVLCVGSVVVVFSSLFNLPSIFLIVNEVMLFFSLFTPGYLIQLVVTGKLLRITLSKGERIACSFVLGLFLISSLSFITSFIGVGLSEIFYSYFIASSIMLVIILFLNRSWIFSKLSSMFKAPRLPVESLLLLSLLFLVIPLYYYFGFAKFNWDGFTFFLRDALAIMMSNSISPYYPESIYDGNVPLIFNSYLSTVLYSYGLTILNVNDFDGNIPSLMQYTSVVLSFIVFATLLATTLLLRSFAYRVFKDKYLVAATIIIFLASPLLIQFFYSWSFNADLFFAFETLLVLVFAYRYLKTDDRRSQYFSLLMIALGLCLAVTTKIYGYVLLAIVPLLVVNALRKDFVLFRFRLKPKDTGFPSYLSKVIIIALFAAVMGFASLYTVWGIMLIGSPFGYSIERLVNYSDNERWADNILDSSEIHVEPEIYPLPNQNTALLLSYGLFPVLLFPLLTGIFLLLKKELWGLGIFVIYILFYYLMFVTILGLQVDRHLFSIIALLPPVYVYGLKNIVYGRKGNIPRYLGWTSEKIILCVTILSVLVQAPLFTAIYTDFRIENFFPSMYFWYTSDNLVNVLFYSWIAFGVAIILGRSFLPTIAKLRRERYIFGILFGITVLAIIGLPTINMIQSYSRYESIIHVNNPSLPFGYEEFLTLEYYDKHTRYPLALQTFLGITGNSSSNSKLLYLHGLGTEFLTMARLSYIKLDDFRMLADLKDVIEEKNADKVHELLLSKGIKFIIYPSEDNFHYRKLRALASVTDEALLFSYPSSVSTEKINLNDRWDLYIV